MAHTSDSLCYCVEVFIVHDGKVLLRKHDKYGIWLSIGGHIDPGETPNDAAKREVFEEVGLKIELWDPRERPSNDDDAWHELVPPVSVGWHSLAYAGVQGPDHVAFVYFARAEDDRITITYESDKSEEFRWFSLGELADIELRSNIRTYAEMALKQLG